MIGKVPLDQLAKDKNLTVEWKAYELRPEDIELPEKTPDYVKKAKASLEALGQKHGLYMTFNEKSRHSRLALEGSKYAEEKGYGDAYHNAVFAAQFQEQKDINDLEVLTELAGLVGLNRQEFRKVLVERRYKEAVTQDVEEAMRLGIQSVPCFIVDGRAIHGSQSYDALERFLRGSERGFPLDSHEGQK